MSSVNSLLDQQKENEKQQEVKQPAVTTVSLHDIMENVLQPYQQEIMQKQLIMRCENLPEVEGSGEDLKKVFLYVISLLVDKRSLGEKKYLHIDCSVEDDSIIDLQVNNGYKFYEIKCKTSNKSKKVFADEDYKQLDECNTLLLLNGGRIYHNLLEGGGQVTIVLPGKPS